MTDSIALDFPYYGRPYVSPLPSSTRHSFTQQDACRWYANVSTFHDLDSQVEHGPTFVYEYSSRLAYGKNITWPDNGPLNATWWHKVTEQMEIDHSLVQVGDVQCEVV